MKKKSLLIALAIIVIDVVIVLYFWQGKGYVTLTSPGVELRVGGLLTSTATIRSGTEPKKIAARVYRPKGATLRAQKDGDRWQLTSHGPWDGLGQIKVLPGKTTTVTLGAPLRITPVVNTRGRRGYVALAIYGQAGERYSNVATKNGRRITAPAVKIIDENGNVLASGRFGYG